MPADQLYGEQQLLLTPTITIVRASRCLPGLTQLTFFWTNNLACYAILVDLRLTNYCLLLKNDLPVVYRLLRCCTDVLHNTATRCTSGFTIDGDLEFCRFRKLVLIRFHMSCNYYTHDRLSLPSMCK